MVAGLLLMNHINEFMGLNIGPSDLNLQERTREARRSCDTWNQTEEPYGLKHVIKT